MSYIRIVGIIEEGVGTPSGVGPGSALYAVPFQLSAVPDDEWKEYFLALWDRPLAYGTMHRPGTARVRGDRIVLSGTTMREVERWHLASLQQAVDEANIRYKAEHRRRVAAQQQQAAGAVQHRQTVREIVQKLNAQLRSVEP